MIGKSTGIFKSKEDSFLPVWKQELKNGDSVITIDPNLIKHMQNRPEISIEKALNPFIDY